jgi:DNA-binding MarR family transcriptional regulator
MLSEKEIQEEKKNIPALAKIEEKDLPNMLFSFYKTLLPEEVAILQILYKKGSLNIKQIRKAYAIQIALEEKNKWLVETFIKEQGDMDIPNKIDDELERALEILKEKDLEKLITYLNKIQPKRIFSYYTLKGLLEHLESMGVIGKREVKDRKVGIVYFLSPSFSKLCLAAIDYIEEKAKKASLSSIEEEVYQLITTNEPPRFIINA